MAYFAVACLKMRVAYFGQYRRGRGFGLRDIRLQSMEMQALIDADIDRTAVARLLMRMQADLALFIEKRERPEEKKAELFSSASGHLVRSGTLADIL